MKATSMPSRPSCFLSLQRLPRLGGARWNVRLEMYASFACCNIHASGRGRPSLSIILSQAVPSNRGEVPNRASVGPASCAMLKRSRPDKTTHKDPASLMSSRP
jgi:hypothetical protein